MAFEADIDVHKTLLELDPGCFDDADVDDEIALLARRLAGKQLRTFSAGDLYGAIRRHMALPWLAPLAIKRLEDDPFLQAAEHPGDLLVAVLESDTRFWQDRHDLWLAMVAVLEQSVNQFNEVVAAAHQTAHPDRTDGPWLPDYLGDDFIAALLHFRGIHSE